MTAKITYYIEDRGFTADQRKRFLGDSGFFLVRKTVLDTQTVNPMIDGGIDVKDVAIFSVNSEAILCDYSPS